MNRDKPRASAAQSSFDGVEARPRRRLTHEIPQFSPRRFGRFQLIERIAVGGMAEIFKAKCFGAHGFEKDVVVKRILPQLAKDKDFVDMFIDEGKLMAQLNHPNIVHVFDFGDVEGQFYIAMEYVGGIDALAMLSKCVDRRLRPMTAVAVHIVSEILDALDYVHTLTDDHGNSLRVVHRDISPSNIFISQRGNIKLGDFGIARALMRRGQTEVGILKGKYGYMAPEQVSGMPSDHRSDIFSAGIVLAELLMVRRLFTAKNELDVLLQVRDARLDRLDLYGDRIPQDLRQILNAALERDPTVRYQSAAAFRDALQRYLFDNRRMVDAGHVARFMTRLSQDPAGRIGFAGDKQASKSASASYSFDADALDAPQQGAPRGLTVRTMVQPVRASSSMSSSMDLSAETTTSSSAPLSEISADDFVQVEFRQVGRKRPIAISPPPIVQPLPAGLAHTGEEPRIATEDALAALPELRRSDSFPDFENESVAAMILPHMSSASGGTSTVPTPEIVAARLLGDEVNQSSNLRGELSHHGLYKVMFDLATKESTGILVLRTGKIIKELFIKDGHACSVASNQPEELFGQYLVKCGAISDGELSMALAMLPHFQGRLGDTLVALKLLSPVEVLRHLTHQVRQKLIDAFDWQDGSYLFLEEAKLTNHESAPVGLDTFELLGAAVLALSSNTVDAHMKHLAARRLVATPRLPVPIEVFRLGALIKDTLQQFSGRKTTGEVLASQTDPAKREHLSRVIFLLHHTGLILEKSLTKS